MLYYLRGKATDAALLKNIFSQIFSNCNNGGAIVWVEYTITNDWYN